MGLLVLKEAVATGERKELQQCGQLVRAIPREFCWNLAGRKQFGSPAALLMHRHRHWIDDDHLHQFTTRSCVKCAENCQSGGDREWLSPWTRVHCSITATWLVHGRPYAEHFGRLGRKRLAACECAPVCAPLGVV